jgi:hypothetical protein
MLQFSDLIIFLLIALLVAYWWQWQSVRQIALQACKDYCRARNIQLLDQTVALRAVRFKRDAGGRLRLWRLFLFEFTASGSERCNGHVLMLGSRILEIYLEPYPVV